MVKKTIHLDDWVFKELVEPRAKKARNMSAVIQEAVIKQFHSREKINGIYGFMSRDLGAIA